MNDIKLQALTQRASQAVEVAKEIQLLNDVHDWGQADSKLGWKLKDDVFKLGKQALVTEKEKRLESLISVEPEPEKTTEIKDLIAEEQRQRGIPNE